MKLLVTGGSGFIGTNLVEAARADGVDVLNVDIAAPRDPRHGSSHARADILDRDSMVAIARAFAPTHVVHLAARTDTELGPELFDYRANTQGTANVLAAVAACDAPPRLVVASTQFVCRPGVAPAHDEIFAPHTVYGWSKVISEQLTRFTPMSACWTIVRPTTVWGPWSATHPARMIGVMRRGLYVHPAGAPCYRGYGYVGNVVFQIRTILERDEAAVRGKVFYVGDRVRDLREWVDAISQRVTGHGVRTAPRPAMRVLAGVGDVVTRARGTPFLLQSPRLRSMTESYPVPMEPTFALTGEPPFTLERGIDATLAWMRSQSIG